MQEQRKKTPISIDKELAGKPKPSHSTSPIFIPPKKILQAFDGLTYELLHYFEYRGFIHPLKTKRGKLDRRKYTSEDFERIKLIWKYYKEGFPPKVAFEKAMKEMRDTKLISLTKLPEQVQKALMEIVRKAKLGAALAIGSGADEIVCLIEELSPGIDIELLSSATKEASDKIRQKGQIVRIKGKDLQADAAITQDEIVVHSFGQDYLDRPINVRFISKGGIVKNTSARLGQAVIENIPSAGGVLVLETPKEET